MSFDNYKIEIVEDVKSCLETLGCKPILFVGSGLSRRYFGTPSWDELLEKLASQCPLIDKNYTFYKQSFEDQAAIGEEFSKLFHRWAWEKGNDFFPPPMFTGEIPQSSYLKYATAMIFQNERATPRAIDNQNQLEIAALQKIQPHALITTNFDQYLEDVFPDYEPIIGQHIIREPQILTGEIFKIHGCVSDINSIILTKSDYEHFMKKKKYLSAKLLTYFSEHPLLIVGYSASDPNIKSILSDIDLCLRPEGDTDFLIPNIYFVEWKTGVALNKPSKEKLIPTEDNRFLRVKAIESDDFCWIFDAFATRRPLNNINPKLLRGLVSRTHELVRHDIPKSKVQFNYDTLSRALDNTNDYAKLLGITTVNAFSSNSIQYPYSLTEVARIITKNGKAYWNAAHEYVLRIKRETGQDIKSFDNRYHQSSKAGIISKSHNYSQEFVDLIFKMRSGAPYVIDL